MRQQFTMLIPTEYTISNNRAAQVWKRKLDIGALA